MPISPSGRQHHLRHGALRAVITEVGAGLRTFIRGDWEVLDGYAEDEICPAANGAVLAPWPNRLEDGRYEFGGLSHQLPLSEPERGNAIHGLVRWLAWETREESAAQVVLGTLLHPQPGYPFSLELVAGYRLDDAGLTVTTTARNAGTAPLPFGSGHHPYLKLGTDLVDQAWLRLPAQSRLELDPRQNATGRSLAVAGTEYDFRSGRALGPLRLDTAFTDLLPDPDGRSRTELRGGDRPPGHPLDGLRLPLPDGLQRRHAGGAPAPAQPGSGAHDLRAERLPPSAARDARPGSWRAGFLQLGTHLLAIDHAPPI